MSNPASSSPTQRTAIDASGHSDRYIEGRIETTRSRVKVIELATSIATLAAGILAYLLTLTLIDHWIWGLNLWTRLLAFILLLIGVTAYVVIRVLPGLLRPVNPVYAARAIEESSPSLKNSLINFMLLRQHDAGIRRVIYEGVRRQAAAGLSHVDVATAVDRSGLIRVGYVLATLVIIFGLYRVLSPKDPFQSVARVAAPWERIARPARVEIEQLEPGNVEIYQGESLTVSATVSGLKDDEPVTLYFSTVDGQLVDQRVAMSAEDGSNRFRCELTSGSMGIQHDLEYHLRAGDAQTDIYRVTVRDALSISIRRITYRYPAYTGIPEQVVEGTGNLKALEGTRAHIEAVANQSIRNGYLELFEPDSDQRNEPDKSALMSHEGQVASGRITLALRPDRSRPLFSAYQLRFDNHEGQRNREPARYTIEVTPDLPPLVEIVQPTRRDVEVPVNRSLRINVRSLDPDFSLRRVRLIAVAGGLEVLNQTLLDEEHQGPIVLNYDLRPQRLGLAVGDSVVYWAEAEDNRRAAGTNSLEPNSRRTANFRIRVTDPDPNSGGSESESDPSENGEPGSDGGSDDPNAAATANPADGSPGEEGNSGNSANDAQGEDSAANRAQGDPSQSGSENSDDAGPPSDVENDQNESRGNGRSSDPTSSNDTAESERGSGNQPSAESDSPADSGDGSEGVGDEPVASDGSNDADAIRRILDHKRKEDAGDGSQGERATDSDPHSADQPSDDGQSDDGQSDDGQSDGQAPRGNTSPTEPGDEAKPGEQRRQGTDRTSANQRDPLDGSESDGSRSGGSRSDERRADERRADERSDGPEADSQRDNSQRADSQRDGSADSRRDDPQTEGPRGDSTRPPQPSSQNRSGDRPIDAREASDQEGDGSEETADGNSPSESRPGNTAGQRRTERQGTDSADNGPDDAADGRSPADPSGDGRRRDGRRADDQPRDAQPRDAQSEDSANATSDSPAQTDGAESRDLRADDSSPNESSRSPDRSTDASGDSASLSGGGRTGQGSGDFDRADVEEDVGDDPNLDFAREATDLALEHLDSQQDNRELLERLGWTPEEARAFLERWRRMRQNAQQQGPRGQQSRRELDDVLRSLGLRPTEASTRRIESDDGFRQLRDDGGRSAPPAEYLEQYRAFLRSFSRTRSEEDAANRPSP